MRAVTPPLHHHHHHHHRSDNHSANSQKANNYAINVRREQPILSIQPWSHSLFFTVICLVFSVGLGGSCSCLSTLCCVHGAGRGGPCPSVRGFVPHVAPRRARPAEFRCCLWNSVNSRPLPPIWSGSTPATPTLISIVVRFCDEVTTAWNARTPGCSSAVLMKSGRVDPQTGSDWIYRLWSL